MERSWLQVKGLESRPRPDHILPLSTDIPSTLDIFLTLKTQKKSLCYWVLLHTLANRFTGFKNSFASGMSERGRSTNYTHGAGPRCDGRKGRAIKLTQEIRDSVWPSALPNSVWS